MQSLSKRIFAIILVILLIFSDIVSVFANNTISQSDIEGHWAEETMRQWVNEGLLSGFGNQKYQPDESITRAQYVAFINRVFEFTEEEEHSFTDIPPSSWHAKEIKRAVAKEYIYGYSDGTMRPNAGVSRIEAAAILARLVKLKEDLKAVEEFTDYKEIPAWGINSVSAAINAGLMSDFINDTFDSKTLMTRAETISALQRTRDLLKQKMIEVITIEEPGTYGPEEGTEIYNEIHIKSPDVILQNIIVKNDLIIGEEVGDGDVTLNKVTVLNGALIVLGGGTDSIYINGGQYKSIQIKNTPEGGVRVVAVGVLDEEGNAVDLEILEDVEGRNVILEGDFDEVNIFGSNIEVETKGETRFKKIRLVEGSKNVSINISSGTNINLLENQTEERVFVRGSGVVESEDGTFSYIRATTSSTSTAKPQPPKEHTYTATFTVTKDGANPIAGASITVDSQTLITDASGIATLDLKDGTYTYSITAAEFYDIKDVQIIVSGAAVDETVRMSAILDPTHKVTFTLSDGSNPVLGASITINNQILTTDVNGIATLDLEKGTYAYSITAVEFYDIKDGEIIVSDAAVEETVNMTAVSAPIPVYEVLFVVLEGKSEVEGAKITLDSGDVLTTGNFGTATTQLASGTYNYNISIAGNIIFTGTITILEEALTEWVQLLDKFPVTYVVTDRTDSYNRDPLEGVEIIVDGQSAFTDFNGEVVIYLSEGQYDFTAQKEGYVDYFDQVWVSIKGGLAFAPMRKKTYKVDFTITDADVPLSSATVEFNGAIYTPDHNGNVTIENLLNGTYDYEIRMKGYDTQTGSATVNDETPNLSISVILNKDHDNVLLTVVDREQNPLPDALVVVNKQIAKTDTNGLASFHVDTDSNGALSYDLKASKYGYFKQSSIRSSGSGNDEATILLPNRYECMVNFTLFDDYPGQYVKNAKIVAKDNSTNDTFATAYTDENGQANLSLLSGDYTFIFDTQYHKEFSIQQYVSVNRSYTFQLQAYTREVTFNAKSEGSSLGGAYLYFDGDEGSYATCEDDGIFSAQTLPIGVHNYTIKRLYYHDLTGTFNLEQGNDIKTINVRMNPILYNTKFIISSPEDVLSNAQLTINGITYISDSNGIIVAGLPYGTHNYTVKAQDFSTYNDSVNIAASETTRTITLERASCEVIFNVVDNDSAIDVANATIHVNSRSYITNADGQVSVQLPTGEQIYSITADGYDSITNTAVISGNNYTENISLNKTRYIVNIAAQTLDTYGIYYEEVKNITVYINGETISSGIGGASIELPDGTYNFTVSSENFEDEIGVVTVSGTHIDKIITMTPILNTVTFVVTDGTSPLNGVQMAVPGYYPGETDENGICKMNFRNDEHLYSVYIPGYKIEKGTIITDHPLTKNVILEEETKLATVYVQRAGYGGFEGAKVTIGDKMVYSNVNGSAFFNLTNGDYIYKIEAEGYSTITGALNITDDSSFESVTLEEITYGTSFNIIDVTGVVVDGTVWIKQRDTNYFFYQVSTTSGIAELELPYGSYSYKVESEGYDDAMGDFDIIDTAVSKTVQMQPVTWTVTFNVNDGIDYIPAQVTLNDEQANADQSGIVNFDLPDGIYDYKVEYDGYESKQGLITVGGEKINQYVVLSHTEYPVNFTVNDGTNNISDAHILIDGIIYDTDESGCVMAQLPSGNTNYSVFADGMMTENGQIQILSEGTDVTIVLTPINYRVRFVVKDGTVALSNRDVKIVDEKIKTNTNGVADFMLPNGTYSYYVLNNDEVEYSNSLTIASTNEYIVVSLEPVYELTLYAMDGDTTVQGVQVQIDDNIQTTDASGKAVFNLRKGNYFYEVLSSSYEYTAGNIQITTDDKITSVSLTKQTFAVTFNVTDDNGNAVVNTLIVSNNAQGYTSDNGSVTLSLPLGDNQYEIISDKHAPYQRSVTVSSANDPIFATLTPLGNLVNFSIQHNSYPVSGVDVVIYNDNKSKVVFSGISNSDGAISARLITGDYHYEISKDRMAKLTGSITVLTTEEQTLALTLVSESIGVDWIVVNAAGIPVEGAVITVANTSATTDANGKAVLQIASGSFDYTIVAQGYRDYINSGAVFTPGTIEITMIQAVSAVTFIVTENDGETPVENAIVTMENKRYFTDSTGKVTLYVYYGDQSYSVEAYGYVLYNSTISVNTSQQAQSVLLTEQEYQLIINVNDGILPIQGAIVTIAGESVVTDLNGQATFQKALGSYDYSITASNYTDNQGTVKVQGSALSVTENLDKKLLAYTFTLTDGERPIYGAKISIDEKTAVTDSNGKATFNLIAGNYHYQLSALHYVTKEGNIDVSEEKLSTTNILDSKQYTIQFNVTDGINVLNDVQVMLGGIPSVAKEDGTYEFTSLLTGTYAYSILREGYVTKISELTVTGNSTVTVNLDKLKYEATFYVTEDTNPINDASVLIDGNVYSTNILGSLTVDLTEGDYDYTVQKDGYVSKYGTLHVSSSEVHLQSVQMEEQECNGVFIVNDTEANPIENAQITINDQIVTTDANGKASITLAYGNYDYSISFTDHKTVYGYLLTNDINFSKAVELEHDIYSVDIVVTDDDSYIQNATVTVNGNQAITNQYGEATFDVTQRAVNCSVYAEGYEIASSDSIIEGSNITLYIQLQSIPQQVTFITNPVGAKVTVYDDGGVAIGTIASTSASTSNYIMLNKGNYSYVIYLEDYKSVGGQLTVSNSSQSVENNLVPLTTYYNATFKIMFEDNPVSGATIQIDNDTQITDNSGEVTFNNLLESSYFYIVTSSSHKTVTDIFTVSEGAEPITINLSSKPYELNFRITETDGTTPIELAKVVIGNQSVYSDSNGIATLFLEEGSYSYAAYRYEYQDVSGSIIITGEGSVEHIEMPPYKYPLKVKIYDPHNNLNVPITGANVIINGNTEITNSEGIANFELMKGTYSCTLEKQGYNTQSWNVNASSSGVGEDGYITRELPMYETHTVIEITVTDGETAIENAKVNLDGQMYQTESQGKISINKLRGTYNYSVYNDHYESVTGNITINVADAFISQQVILAAKKYPYMFKFKGHDSYDGSSHPVAGITVTINGDTKTSNSDGEVVFQLPAGNFNYTMAAADDYRFTNNSTNLIGSAKIYNGSGSNEVDMKVAYYPIEIIVKEGADPVTSVDVKVGDDTRTTDSNGKVLFMLQNGTYSYKTDKWGYDSSTADFIVDNSELTLNADIQPKENTLTLNVTSNGSALQDAVVRIGAQSIQTTANGNALFTSMPSDTYYYSVSMQGYSTLRGTIRINDNISLNAELQPLWYYTRLLVLNEENQPISGAKVTVDAFREYTTNENGSVNLMESKGIHSYTVSKLGYSDFTDDINIDIDNSEKTVLMTQTGYPATIKVLGNGSISGANITIDDITLTTDSNGEAKFTLVNGDYSYSVTADGYVKGAGVLSVFNTATSITLTLSNVRFKVSEQSNPLGSAVIEVNNQKLITDINGYADIYLTAGNTYSYTIKKAGYSNYEGQLTVNSSGIISCEDTLSAIKYSVKFTVGDRINLLQGVTVTVDGQSLMTDEQGIALVELKNGYYEYIIEKIGYYKISDSFVIDCSDNEVNKTMTMYSNLMQLTLKDTFTSDVLSNTAVIIKLGGQYGQQIASNINMTSDAQGVVEFRAPYGLHEVSVVKDGYNIYQDILYINNQHPETARDIWIEPIKNTLSFVVSSKTVAKEGALITVGGKRVYTDTNGLAEVDMPKGTWAYSVQLNGYVSLASDIEVVGSEVTKSINLNPAKSVNFTISDSNGPIHGAVITVDNISYITQWNGTTTLMLEVGENDYSVSALGNETQTGTVDVEDINVNGHLVTMQKTKHTITINVSDEVENISGANVWVGDDSGSLVTTNSDGNCELVSVEYGYQIIYVEASGYDMNQSSVFVKDETLQYNIGLTTYNIAPALTHASTSANGMAVLLEFDKNISQISLDPFWFTVKSNGNEVNLKDVTLVEARNIVHLDLESRLDQSETLVSYAPGSMAGENGSLLNSITNQQVSNALKPGDVAYSMMISGLDKDEVYSAINDLFDLTTKELIFAILAGGYSIEDVAVMLYNNGNSYDQIAATLLDSGVSSINIPAVLSNQEASNEQIFIALINADVSVVDTLYALKVNALCTARDAVGILFDAGYTLKQIAVSVVDAYSIDDAELPKLLKGKGYTLDDIVTLLKGEPFNMNNSRVVTLLKEASYATVDVASVLEEDNSSDSTEAAGILLSMGFDASDVIAAIMQVYNADVDSIATAMNQAGLTVSETAMVLWKYYNYKNCVSTIASVLKNAGYSKTSIGEVVKNSRISPSWYSTDAHYAASDLANADFEISSVAQILQQVYNQDSQTVIHTLSQSRGFDFSEIVSYANRVYGFSAGVIGRIMQQVNYYEPVDLSHFPLSHLVNAGYSKDEIIDFLSYYDRGDITLYDNMMYLPRVLRDCGYTALQTKDIIVSVFDNKSSTLDLARLMQALYRGGYGYAESCAAILTFSGASVDEIAAAMTAVSPTDDIINQQIAQLANSFNLSAKELITILMRWNYIGHYLQSNNILDLIPNSLETYYNMTYEDVINFLYNDCGFTGVGSYYDGVTSDLHFVWRILTVHYSLSASEAFIVLKESGVSSFEIADLCYYYNIYNWGSLFYQSGYPSVVLYSYYINREYYSDGYRLKLMAEAGYSVEEVITAVQSSYEIGFWDMLIKIQQTHLWEFEAVQEAVMNSYSIDNLQKDLVDVLKAGGCNVVDLLSALDSQDVSTSTVEKALDMTVVGYSIEEILSGMAAYYKNHNVLLILTEIIEVISPDDQDPLATAVQHCGVGDNSRLYNYLLPFGYDELVRIFHEVRGWQAHEITGLTSEILRYHGPHSNYYKESIASLKTAILAEYILESEIDLYKLAAHEFYSLGYSCDQTTLALVEKFGVDEGFVMAEALSYAGYDKTEVIPVIFTHMLEFGRGYDGELVAKSYKILKDFYNNSDLSDAVSIMHVYWINRDGYFCGYPSVARYIYDSGVPGSAGGAALKALSAIGCENGMLSQIMLNLQYTTDSDFIDLLKPVSFGGLGYTAQQSAWILHRKGYSDMQQASILKGFGYDHVKIATSIYITPASGRSPNLCKPLKEVGFTAKQTAEGYVARGESFEFHHFFRHMIDGGYNIDETVQALSHIGYSCDFLMDFLLHLKNTSYIGADGNLREMDLYGAYDTIMNNIPDATYMGFAKAVYNTRYISPTGVWKYYSDKDVFNLLKEKGGLWLVEQLQQNNEDLITLGITEEQVRNGGITTESAVAAMREAGYSVTEMVYIAANAGWGVVTCMYNLGAGGYNLGSVFSEMYNGPYHTAIGSTIITTMMGRVDLRKLSKALTLANYISKVITY